MKKFISALMVLWLLPVLAEADPHYSFPYLTTSNGLIVAVYNADKNQVDNIYPHIFANYDSGKFVHPFIGNLRLATDQKPNQIAYWQNTHIIRCDYTTFSVFYFASFASGEKIFYAVIKGRENDVKSLGFDYESGDGKIQSGITHLANPLEDLPLRFRGQLIRGEWTRNCGADCVEKYFLFSMTDSLHHDKAIVDKAIKRLKSTNSSFLEEELKWMRNVISHCRIPAQLTQSERNLVEQSISILKMSQVSGKEIFPLSRGQVLASLRPGLWHVAWVRDGSYAIQAMTRLGMYTEAKKALEFMLKAKANRFKHYVYLDGKDYGPGVDYKISLTRYFGNGTEECDYNEYGPNIEYDDWGLFLTAFTDYVALSNDFSFYQKWNAVVRTKVADAIVAVIGDNSLIRPDSGPWEHHLNDTKQYCYTSAVCAEGLKQFAALQKQLKLPFAKYQSASEKITEGIFNHLLVDRVYFKGNVQDRSKTDREYYDGGTFELFANGLVKDNSIFDSHLKEYGNSLRIRGDREGYIRLNTDDVYENQEWVYLDLRIARGYILNGEKAKAKSLIDYVTKQASFNNNHIPEMYSYTKLWKKPASAFESNNIWCYCVKNEEESYIGAIPMVGYGSGAYIISLYDYYETK